MNIDPGLAGIIMTTIVSLVALIFRYFPAPSAKLPVQPAREGKSVEDRLLELELNYRHLESKVDEIKGTIRENVGSLKEELGELKTLVLGLKGGV